MYVKWDDVMPTADMITSLWVRKTNNVIVKQILITKSKDCETNINNLIQRKIVKQILIT